MSATRDNLLANVFQQVGGAVLLLTIPSLVAVPEFGRITVIMTLLSLAAISDFGFSHVYTRKTPPIFVIEDHEAVLRWDVVAVTLRLVGGCVFGILASLYYGINSGKWGEAFLVLLIFPFFSVVAFLASRGAASGSFRTVRNLSLAQALGRLVCIPGSIVAGVSGWVFGQIFSNLASLMLSTSRVQLSAIITKYHKLDWNIFRQHFREAVVLSLIAGVWTQLMSSGRLFAVLNYPVSVVASYGLVASIQQVGASVILAAFVPQTIRLYRELAQSTPAGVDRAVRIASLGGGVAMVLSLIGILVALPLLHSVFPKYAVSNELVVTMIMSVANCGIVSSLGSVMIGTGNSRPYLVILLVSFGISMLLPYVLEPWFGPASAAYSQLVTMSFNSLLLVITIYRRFGCHLPNRLPIMLSGVMPLVILALAPMLVAVFGIQ